MFTDQMFLLYLAYLHELFIGTFDRLLCYFDSQYLQCSYFASPSFLHGPLQFVQRSAFFKTGL